MENVQMFLMSQLTKISEHAIHHGLVVLMFSLIGLSIGVIWQRWKQARYGMRVSVRVCWVEKDDTLACPVLVDKVLLTGSALEMTGGKDAAAALVRAAKRCRIDGLIGQKCWKLASAKHVLERVSHRIESMFSQGSVAQAMQDKDVTRGEFAIAACRRGNEVSVIMAQRKDLASFMAPTSLRTINGDIEELREMEQLASIYLGITKECGTMVVLYM